MPTLLTAVLTKAGVARVETRAREYVVWDEQVQGLCLRVLPTGRKIYELRARMGRLSLGVHPALSPREARKRARAQLKAFHLANFIADAARHWQGAREQERALPGVKRRPEFEIGRVSGAQANRPVSSGVTPAAGRAIAHIKRAKAANIDTHSTRKRVA